MTPPVFAHGHLRLFLLKLVDEQPRHGYELIQALSDRFDGAYAPSAGTVYPRLAKLEAEGLIRKEQQGRKTVYHVTEEGHREVLARREEIEAIEREAQSTMQEDAADVRRRVSEAASQLRAEFAGFTKRAREERRDAGEDQSLASELGQMASELGQMAAQFGRRTADAANAGWSAAEQARARGEDIGQAAGAGFRAAASSATGKASRPDHAETDATVGTGTNTGAETNTGTGTDSDASTTTGTGADAGSDGGTRQAAGQQASARSGTEPGGGEPRPGSASPRGRRDDASTRVDLALDAFRRDVRQDVRFARTRGEVPPEIADLLGAELSRVRELMRHALRL